jgi:hypothetical protein
MVWEQVGEAGHYLNGAVFWHALQSMVPRILMPGKDKTVPLDSYIESAIGLPDFDGCLTSYGYAFAEGGWPGVFGFHILLGIALALLTKKAVAGSSPIWWLACAFGWEVVLQMENEVLMDALSAVRCVAIYGVLLGLFSLIGRSFSVSRRCNLPVRRLASTQ